MFSQSGLTSEQISAQKVTFFKSEIKPLSFSALSNIHGLFKTKSLVRDCCCELDEKMAYKKSSTLQDNKLVVDALVSEGKLCTKRVLCCVCIKKGWRKAPMVENCVEDIQESVISRSHNLV